MCSAGAEDDMESADTAAAEVAPASGDSSGALAPPEAEEVITDADTAEGDAEADKAAEAVKRVDGDLTEEGLM